MSVAAQMMAIKLEQAPSHLRRLDTKLIPVDNRLREWSQWQGKGGGVPHLGYPDEWVTGKIRSGSSGPVPAPKEPHAVTETHSAVHGLDECERKVIYAAYCNSWMGREERYKLTGMAEREYRETLRCARWELKGRLKL